MPDQAPLTCEEIAAISHGFAQLTMGPTARTKLENGRAIVERILKSGTKAYGITTGLGALSGVALASNELAPILRNTLLSHACGVGEPLHPAETRSILVALVNDICHGYSGASIAVVVQLGAFLNRGIGDVAYQGRRPAADRCGPDGWPLSHQRHALPRRAFLPWHGRCDANRRVFARQ